MAAAISGELVVCFGEMLIDFVPDVAGVSLADCKAFVKAAGGAPANVAVAVARLGGRPAFIGKVGNDEFGHMLVNILKRNDVNTAGVRFDKDARTALAFVTLTSSGEREFMFYRNPSADMLLTRAELDFDLIRRASIFHFGSISLISEPCRSTHLAAIAAARKAGALLTYDVNIRIPLWPSPQAARRGVMSIWNQADVIKVSDDEVAFLTQGDPENDDVIKSLWFDDLKLLVVTAGEKGSRYLTKNFQGMVPGYAVEKVDATGAGDAFVGSLLLSIAKDEDIFEDEKKLRNALVFASACGAITATKKGAIPALPTPAMVEDFIANPKLVGSNKELIVDGEERNPSLRRRKGGVGNGSTIGYSNQRPQFEADANSRLKKSSKLVVAISIGFILTFLLALITKLYWVRSN